MYVPTGIQLPALLLESALIGSARFDIYHGPGQSRFSDSQPTIDLYEPDLRSYLPSGRWVRAHLVALYPSQQIVAHADAAIAPAIRYHIPLSSNAGCWCLHDGVWAQLETGHVYSMDPALEHGAVNWGATNRVHLLVDVAHAD